jgi:hypothetical protein
MIAGLNIRVDVWRIDTGDDDIVGGAVITGSLVYSDVACMMQPQDEEQLLLQQGIETVRIFNANVVPGTLDIREKDQLEISKPQDHPDWSNRFRVITVSKPSHNPRDPRNYLRLVLTRSVRAHSNQ